MGARAADGRRGAPGHGGQRPCPRAPVPRVARAGAAPGGHGAGRGGGWRASRAGIADGRRRVEGAGYDVRFLGADVPESSLAAWVSEHHPAIVALGSTMPWVPPPSPRQLQALRDRDPELLLITGGQGVPAVLRESAGVLYAADTEQLAELVNSGLGLRPVANAALHRPRRRPLQSIRHRGQRRHGGAGGTLGADHRPRRTRLEPTRVARSRSSNSRSATP